MTSRRKRSRKRSAASSIAKRLESTVFYLDESIYSRVLYERMVSLGARVERVGEAFPFGSSDQVWLKGCGQRGWVALTRDRNIRRRPLERRAIRSAGAAVFVFTAGGASAGDTANSIARLLHRFVNIAASEKRPFVRTFGFGNTIGRVKLEP
jgi:hypothetical protein